jgi:hypothetical protein
MRVITCRLSGLTPAVSAQRGRPGGRQIFLAYFGVYSSRGMHNCTTWSNEDRKLRFGQRAIKGGPTGELPNARFSVTLGPQKRSHFVRFCMYFSLRYAPNPSPLT